MILRSDPAWHTARLGKVTASNAHKFMDFTAKGVPTAARNKYLFEVVAERMTDIIVPHPVNEAMQWGIDHQAAALAAFEIETGLLVGPEAFYSHPDIEGFGATPDGVVGTSVVEVKCPMTATHLQYCESRQIPQDYRYQMVAQLLCTGLMDGYFVSFDPRIRNRSRTLILPFKPSAEFLGKVLAGAKQFLHDVEVLFEKVTHESGYFSGCWLER